MSHLPVNLQKRALTLKSKFSVKRNRQDEKRSLTQILQAPVTFPVVFVNFFLMQNVAIEIEFDSRR